MEGQEKERDEKEVSYYSLAADQYDAVVTSAYGGD